MIERMDGPDRGGDGYLPKAKEVGMTIFIDECQTPYTGAEVYVGNSGIRPKQSHESRFVADKADGVLDIQYTISISNPRVTVCIETTRYVGSVDADGFLLYAQQHIDQGTLAEKLLLRILARISANDIGGTLGKDASDALSVEVFLHRGVPNREKSLGYLEGDYGLGGSYWQLFELEVDVWDVRFPDDPCPGQGPSEPCDTDITPASNEITFEFKGTAVGDVFMEVDWLTLKPKDERGLAWRPVLLLHGLQSDATAMRPGTAWADGLQARNVAYHAVNLSPKGSIFNNGHEITVAVDDLKQRFGVERVHLVGHCKGGIDAREHVRLNNDVEALIMLGAPNAGSFLADLGALAGGAFIQSAEFLGGQVYCSTSYMVSYNLMCGSNPRTTYVGAAGDNYGPAGLQFYRLVGPNDGVVAVWSVHSLPYAHPFTDSSLDSRSDHFGLRFNTRFVDKLFPRFMAVLTPPDSTSRAARAPTLPARVEESDATGVQRVMSGTGTAASSATASHSAVVDPPGPAIFIMFGDQDALRFELVSPGGARIDAATPLADPTIAYTSHRDEESLAYAAYCVEAPEIGGWTLEVTGRSGSPPEGSPYGVAVVVPLTPGSGMTLTSALDQDHYAVGSAVTISATVVENGAPVTDATVTVVVTHPDGTTATQVVLYDNGTNGDPAAGDGVYTGLFTATTDAGCYVIVVSAARAAPAFTREQILLASIAQSSTAFTGTLSDHGTDSDGDGLYNQLVIDVEVTVDVTGLYRLFGTLTDGAGTTIEQVRVEQELPPGLQTISLPFDGAPLFALSHDGSYVVEDLVLEEVATAIGLGQAPPYTTAVYVHTAFQRPPCLLTGNASDYGMHTGSTGLMPYEALVVAVEVDMLFGADVQANAKLYSEDGAFVTACSTSAVLGPGLTMLEFSFAASRICQSGKPGPYTLRLLSLWGTTLSDAPTSGSPVWLSAPGVVAITQPYQLEDFGAPPATPSVAQ
jgi:hypothetical protein